jgi:hypothetical protein
MSPEIAKPPAVPSSPVTSQRDSEKTKGVAAKADVRFRPDMPQIPGVADNSRRKPGNRQQMQRLAPVLGVVIIIVAGAAWWFLSGGHATRVTGGDDQALATPSPAPPELPPLPAAPKALGRNEIGAVEEFSQPWAAKKFGYTSLLNREVVPAIAIRLPVGDGKQATSYWGILLKAPFAQCDLEFLSDLNQISARFGYHAAHPMVVDACSGIIYDPMRTGTLPDGTWSRGDIVHGQGLRPPMQVEIKVEGGHLYAGRAE